MSVDHDAGKRRQLETASSSDAVETDEQLARRLHEELNALTRHASRRTAVPAPGPKQQPQRSKSDKLPDSKHSKSGSKQPRMLVDADEHYESDEQCDKGDKPARKRSMLNRELAMLVTDMVDSQLKTATGPRLAKSKDEQVVDQHKGSEQQQQLQSVEQLLPILKHESSSSQSEQERLALEHVQAAVADGTPQAKQAQQQQHFMPRVSDSGADAAADSACISGAESSGRDSSSSSGEPDHGQQHTSPAPAHQRRQQDREQQRTSRQQPAGGQGKGKQSAQQQEGGAPAKVIKIPKLPMVEYGKKWYRAKVLKDAGAKVLLEYQGYSHEGGPFWLVKDHPRIWTGSYKGKDWKYLGDGAWEPKGGKFNGKGGRVKPHRSAAAAAAPAAGEGAAAADSDTEQLASRAQRRQAQQQQQQKHKQKQKQPHRRAAAAAAAAATGSLKQEGEVCVVEAAVSERDTTSADQQGQAGNDGDAAGAGLGPEQGEVESGMQLDEPCKQEQPPERVCGSDLVGDAVGMDVDQQQHEPDVEREDRVGAVLRQQQADEHPAELQRSDSTDQCTKAAGSEAVEAAAAVAITAAEVKPEDAPAAAAAAAAAEETAVASDVVQPAAQKDAGAGAMPAPVPAAAAAAAPVPAAAGKIGLGRGKASGGLLLGHTHEEMVAAAAAAVAVAAPPAPRGRATRSGKSKSERSNGGDGANEGASNKRGGRGGRGSKGSAAAQAAAAAAAASAAAAAATAAAASEQQAKEQAKQQTKQEEQAQQQAGQQQQQPAASGSASGSGQAAPGGLRVEPGRGLKHSGSSEGPLSPTSPTGGSPRVHRRRKGVPRRARLDSEDLQRPTKKARGAPKPTVYCDTAMEWQQHEQQVQMQHMMEQRRQQAQQAAAQQAAAWKAANKSNCASSAKKSIWSSGSCELVVGGRDARQSSCWQQEPQQQQQCWPQPSPRQQTLAAAAAAAAAAECQAAIEEQQQMLLLGQAKSNLPHQGSDPEDVEAACVLLGAARAHSGEVLGMPTGQGGFNLQLAQRSFSTSAADEMQLSPRFAGARQAGGGGKRRGHNWSKPTGNNTSRPPRPPQAGAGGPVGTSTGFRQSLTGCLPQQPQLQLQQRRASFNNTELGVLGLDQETPSYGALGSAALSAAAASALGDAAAALLGRQGSLPSPGALQASGSAGGKPRNGSSCALGVGGDSGKQDTLRTLLDAVGQVQSASGRPDLMYPLQFGGVPMGTQLPGKDGKNGVLQPLQLLHTPVSAAAATLLAAVPSLDAVQRMAVLQGQGGVLACLTGQSPSLFL